MKHYLTLLALALTLSLGACSREQNLGSTDQSPFVLNQTEVTPETAEPCVLEHSASKVFLPITSEPSFERIIPAHENECGFYNWAQQTFLHVSQPDRSQQPAFLKYPKFEEVFGLQNLNDSTDRITLNAGFNQAGEQGAILVDQNHNPIFFSLHINKAFADFVKKEGLNDLHKLLSQSEDGGIATDLEFPAGAVELKAAWKIVAAGEDASNYFTLPARVPVLKNEGNKVVSTGSYRDVTVAMLGLHVVGVVEDHPEFVWASFEHIDTDGQPDLSPAAEANPEAGVAQLLQQKHAQYPLFSDHQRANFYAPQPIDEASQTFAQTTPVYRVFPASLSAQSEEDEEIEDLNEAITELFQETDPQAQDPRRYYRMVGAVWIDDPGAERSDGIFKANRVFENKGEDAILAGEDRLSNMGMESFTQTTQPNCFSCHNTLSKYIGNNQFLPPRRVNVSNVLTFFAQHKLD